MFILQERPAPPDKLDILQGTLDLMVTAPSTRRVPAAASPDVLSRLEQHASAILEACNQVLEDLLGKL